MIAAMVEGKVDTADWFFLIAVILATLAAILYGITTRPRPNGGPALGTYAPVLGWLSAAFAFLGWWVL